METKIEKEGKGPIWRGGRKSVPFYGMKREQKSATFFRQKVNFLGGAEGNTKVTFKWRLITGKYLL